MMKKFLLSAILCTGLAACGQGDDGAVRTAAPAPMAYEESADAMMVANKRAGGAMQAPARPMAEPAGEGAPVDDTAGLMLAYEYAAELQVPAPAVAPLMQAHMAECQTAGARICQVVSSNTGGTGEDYAWAALEIRAGRDWMDDFRAGLEGDARGADGQLASSSMRAEDLTRAITDTAARLEAQQTLRDRLLVLLEKDTDEVGDLLEIERELARVQGEIESATSYLRVLRGRVSMDRMSLSYQTKPKAVTASTFDSLGNAFKRFFRVLSDSLATMVLFFAAILPWLIIAVPLLWLLIRVIRGLFRRRKKA